MQGIPLQDLANLNKLQHEADSKVNVEDLHRLQDFHTKIRPGVSRFLRDLAPLYRLYIYTMGDEVYACAMASLLDTEGRLFRNRVINRADSNWAQQQKGLEKLGVAPTMAAVVDDTVGVLLLFLHEFSGVCVSNQLLVAVCSGFATTWQVTCAGAKAFPQALYFTSPHLAC
jgi:TFIIF-interacting CTD phosphatase-like protein